MDYQKRARHQEELTSESKLNTETPQKSNKKNFWAWSIVGFISLIFILSVYDELGNNRLMEQNEEITPRSE